MNIKLCFRVGKSATGTKGYKMLENGYGSLTLSRTQHFEWHRHFRECKGSVEDRGHHSGQPQSFHTAENIEKVSAAVRRNKLQTKVQIVESVGISEATYQRILAKDLNIHRVCQHITPRMLNEDQ
ncbi:uncharacterized protein TNCV_5072871 [Trichonephila clavipes]|nr:uncharacterized protein TNCV_5072871 [Trichonephila clavipes]